MHLCKPSYKSLTHGTEAGKSETLRCKLVYEEYLLEYNFVEALTGTIHHKA